MKAIALVAPLIGSYLLSMCNIAYASIALQGDGLTYNEITTLIASQGLAVVLVVWFIWPKLGGYAQLLGMMRQQHEDHRADMAKVIEKLDSVASCTGENRQMLGNIQTVLSTKPCVKEGDK